MPSLATPAPLDRILSEHVKNLSAFVIGTSGYGQRFQATRYSDATNYANTFGNTDTTNGRALKVQYGDPDGSTVTLATFQKSGTRIQSNDGTDYIDVSNSGVAVTGTFTVNGSTIGGGARVYNVLDYGMVTGVVSTNAAANSAAFVALLVTAAAAGGGEIFFPRGTWPMNATVWAHNLGSSSSISVRGEAGASAIFFFGTTGPFWSLGSSSSHALSRMRIQNLMFLHGAIPTSGATIKIGVNVANVIIDGCYFSNGGAGFAALTAVQTDSGVVINNTKIETRTDSATLAGAGLVPRGVHITATSAVGGLTISNSAIDGCVGVSYGLDFANSGDWDTVQINNSLIKDHQFGIIKAGATVGDVANLNASNVYLDVCEYGIYLVPFTGAAVYTWLISTLWVSATKQALLYSLSNGGTVDGIRITNGYFTNMATAGTAGVYFGDGVGNCTLTDIYINTSLNAPGDYGVDIANADGTTINGCTVVVGTSASNSVRVASTADPVVIAANTFRGKDITFGGSTSASRIYQADNNAFKA